MTGFERVSPLALIYFIGRTLIMFARQAINLLPLLVVIVTGGEALRVTLLWVLAIGLPTVIVLHAVASWWFFRYRAADDTLHLRQGIFKRTQLTLDYDRIQQADIRQPWYFRPFGIAVLGVESAGSEGREVELAGLSYTRAEALRHDMMQQKMVRQREQSQSGDRLTTQRKTSDILEPDSQAVNVKSELRMALPAAEIARYGLIHNPVLLIFPVAAYFLAQFDLMDDWLLPRLDGLSYSTFSNGSLLQSALLWGAVMLMILALIVGLSVLLALVRYHGFTLTVTGPRYQTRAGLLTIVSRSFQYVRLQRLVWMQGPIAWLLRRKGLRIDQSGRPDTLQQAKAFFIPVLERSREQLLRQTLNLQEPVWQPVHPMSMALPWFFLTLAVVTAVALISRGDVLLTGVAAVTSASLSALFVWASWRHRAIFISDDWLALRYGMIGQQQRWIPAWKMQTLRIRQGPWLRRWGMSALHVYSAAGRETVAWLPSAQIEELQARLMARTAAHQGRWM